MTPARPSSMLLTQPTRPLLRDRLLVWSFGALFVLATALALSVSWPAIGQVTLHVGDVSAGDIRSPETIEYLSTVLTEEARGQAERRVADIYEPVRRVRSEQIARATAASEVITQVRDNSTASVQQKLQAVAVLNDIELDQTDWETIFALDEDAWQRVSDEVPTVLSFVLMGEITDNQLAAVRRRVPTYVDLVNDDEARVAIALVRALTKPNMVFNAERTAALKQEARAAVTPQIERYEAGEIVVRAGDLVTARHIEALEAMGLNQAGWNWQRATTALLVAGIMALIFGLYTYTATPGENVTPRRMGLLMALLLAFLFLATVMIPDRTILPYLFPLAAVTMLTGVLLGTPVAFLAMAYFAVVAGYLSNGNVNLVVYLMLNSLVGVLMLRKGERTAAYITAGAAVSGISLTLLLAFNLPMRLELNIGLQLLAAGLASGVIAASIALVGFYMLGAIFDIATPLRLMDLARPNHPLLRELITKAPGTYHHSLLVSNLAEQAAEAIGGDAFLTRVGCYYHDIGKLNRPYFFVENRMEGVNPHSQLDPWSSAQVIISHIKDGLELARRHKLPQRVRDFIAEHQGTGLVRVFYSEAQKQAGAEGVNEADFRYPGPRPRSRETALLMLADSCESAVRAAHPATREEIDQLVQKIINQKMIEGELSESPLTLHDLHVTRTVFVQALQGAHHPRIVYPELPSTAGSDGRTPLAANHD
ncbi:MAG: HDIG domain-containing metalloprotein [Caldilineales bacterium]